jgi:hypothetical protein
MDKFSDLTVIERNILLEYIQSGTIPSDFDGEKYDRLNLIMKKLSTTRRSKFPGKNEKDGLVEDTASKLVDDIIDGIPDKSGTLLLTIPSLGIKSILTQDSVISNLPAYISTVTIERKSMKLYVYAVDVADVADRVDGADRALDGRDGTYYVIDNDTDPKETLYSQDSSDLGTALGSYTGGKYGSATVTLYVSRG